MDKHIRDTGISMIGNVPWGTHFCQFYSSKEDLLDILVPYFRKGLEDNEFCMWVTSDPLGVEDAAAAMRSAVPGFDERLSKGQIEIVPYDKWYTRTGRFDSARVLRAWGEKLEAALQAGYEGMRLTGNTFWLERGDWDDFRDYEEEIDRVIRNYRMMAICTYSLDKCGASEIIDVLSNHKFALIRRAGKWETIESFGRKLVEKLLRDSEEKYRIVADNTYDWEFWVDSDNRFRYVSPSCKRISGRDPEEFFADPGLRISMIYPEDRPVFERHLEEVEKRRPGELEYRIVLPGGATRWIGHVCQPVYDSEGRFLGTRGSNRDITDSKLAEQRTKASEERYRSLFGSMMNGFALHEIICDEKGEPIDYRFLEVNKAFEELTGLKREAVIGKTALEVMPGTEPYWIENFGKVALTGEPVRFENYSRELGRFYEVVAYSPAKNQFATVFADITERKRMEGELRKGKDELEARVLERTAELEKTLEQLGHSNQKLQEAIRKVKMLKGLLPICASCKRIRNEEGQWEGLERFIERRSAAEFSHSICPECAERLYPEFKEEMK